MTLDYWVRRHVRAGIVACDVLVLDEYTQINAALWSDVALAHMAGVRIVLSGDRHQFAAVLDFWGNASIASDALTDSDMLRELANSRRLVLTDNMRSDAEIWLQFYSSVSRDLYSNQRPRPKTLVKNQKNQRKPKARAQNPRKKHKKPQKLKFWKKVGQRGMWVLGQSRSEPL